MDKKQKQFDLSVYFITDPKVADKHSRSVEETVLLAIQGGATIIQYRDKYLSDLDFVKQATIIQQITTLYKIPFIVNDRVLLAIQLNADGVHIGQKDMEVSLARQLIGEDKILGVSVHDLAESMQAEKDGADYISVGPLYPTRNRTKPDAQEPVGIEAFKLIVQSVSIPVMAIGGIGLDNSHEVFDAGGVGVAMIAAIAGTKDPAYSTKRFRRLTQSKIFSKK